jgi:hypothetical protein
MTETAEELNSHAQATIRLLRLACVDEAAAIDTVGKLPIQDVEPIMLVLVGMIVAAYEIEAARQGRDVDALLDESVVAIERIVREGAT